MQLNIPDDVKEAFEAAYKGADADTGVAELLRKAAVEPRTGTRTETARSSGRLVEMMQNLRAQSPTFADEEIRKARAPSKGRGSASL